MELTWPGFSVRNIGQGGWEARPLVLQQMMLKETFPFGLLSLYLNTYVEKVTHVKQAGSWGPMGVS